MCPSQSPNLRPAGLPFTVWRVYFIYIMLNPAGAENSCDTGLAEHHQSYTATADVANLKLLLHTENMQHYSTWIFLQTLWQPWNGLCINMLRPKYIHAYVIMHMASICHISTACPVEGRCRMQMYQHIYGLFSAHTISYWFPDFKSFTMDDVFYSVLQGSLIWFGTSHGHLSNQH